MPRFYSGLCRLVGVQTVQEVHWHTQRLTVCKGSWRDPSRVCHCVIHTQFDERNSFHPIVNTLMNQGTNYLLNGTVLTFRLAVGLGVISTTKQSLRSEHGPQCTPERRSETNVTVVNQPLRYTIVPYPIRKEQFCHFGCRQAILPHPSWNQAGKFAKLVATHHQCVLAVTFRQTGDKIHGDCIKFLGWDW